MKFEYTFFANPPLAVFGSARVSARLAALPVCSGPLVLFCFLKKQTQRSKCAQPAQNILAGRDRAAPTRQTKQQQNTGNHSEVLNEFRMNPWIL